MKKGNLILAGVSILLAAATIVRSVSYPAGQDGIPGPGFFPIIIAALMILASVSLVITSLRIKPEEDMPLKLLGADNKRAYLTMAVMIVYVIAMPLLGFCVSSFLLLFGMIRWLSSYKPLVCALVAAAVVGMIYVVFGVVLGVSLGFGLLI